MVKTGFLLQLIGRAMLAPPARAQPLSEPAWVPTAARMTPYFFGLLGIAHDSVIHIISDPAQGVGASDSQTQTRSLLGFGMTYRLTERLALRADADHVSQRRNDKDTGWGNLDFFALGLQHSDRAEP